MFKNKFVIMLIPIFIVVSALLYWVGFYNGARKAFLFNSITNTAVCSNTIKYINNQQYEKAKNVQLSEADVNWATITDIFENRLSIKVAYNKLISYRDLLSYDEKDYIDRAKKGYDRIRSGEGQ